MGQRETHDQAPTRQRQQTPITFREQPGEIMKRTLLAIAIISLTVFLINTAWGSPDQERCNQRSPAILVGGNQTQAHNSNRIIGRNNPARDRIRMPSVPTRRAMAQLSNFAKASAQMQSSLMGLMARLKRRNQMPPSTMELMVKAMMPEEKSRTRQEIHRISCHT